MKFLLSLAIACALSTESLLAQQSSPSPPQKQVGSSEKASKNKAQAAKSSSVQGGEQQEIEIPVPDGVPVKGIKVPSYSADGKLLMMLDAEQARKLDAERIEFENLKIDAYSED
ncbi:MAG TPA: hypothetical protein VIT23_09905, partial [Terrimicrobiaceae bacterium]